MTAGAAEGRAIGIGRVGQRDDASGHSPVLGDSPNPRSWTARRAGAGRGRINGTQRTVGAVASAA